jgi:hypothetical protein
MRSRSERNPKTVTMTLFNYPRRINNTFELLFIMRDRPIVSKGNYDLNFIDWNNEWEQVADVYEDSQNNED